MQNSLLSGNNMYHRIWIAVVVVAAVAGTAITTHGRGFGGFHGGGGFGGGDFGGGRAGGFGGGNFGGGGFHGGGGFNDGFHGGGGGFDGGFHGGGGFGGGNRSYAGGIGGGAIHAYGGNFGGGGMHAYSGSFGGGARNFDSNVSRMFGGNFQGGMSSLERGSGESLEGVGNQGLREGGEADAGRLADSSNMPDTLRVDQAALPTDMGSHSSGDSFAGYSGSARGLSPMESRSFDQEVSQGFANVGNAVAAAEHEG